MTQDWYGEGSKLLLEEIVEDTGINIESVKSIYSWLVNECLIDYDIEKEFIYNRYFEEEE